MVAKRMLNIRYPVSIEPAFFIFCFVYYLTSVLNTNLVLQKICRGNETLVEPDMSTSCSQENEAIQKITDYNAIYQFSAKIVVTILSIFVTAWSDRSGRRKIFVILPIAGILIQTLMIAVLAHYWTTDAVYVVWADCVTQTFSGGMTVMYAFASITILDSTTEANRTVRVSVLPSLQLVAILIATASSGYIILIIGFRNAYLGCAACSVLSLMLAVYFLKEKRQPEDDNESLARDFAKILNISEIVSAFRVVFGNQRKNCRKIIVILYLTNLMEWFVLTGQRSVTYLYFRHKFHWDERIFGIWLSFKMLLHAIGTLFSSIVFSKIFKMHDGVIGSFSKVCMVFSNLGYVLARNNLEVFMIPVIEIFGAVPPLVCDTFLSKFFTSKEFGRVYSVRSTFELIIAVSIPVYNIVLKSSMEYLPSAIFLASIPLHLLCAIFFGTAYILYRKYQTEKNNDNSEICQSIDDTPNIAECKSESKVQNDENVVNK